MSELRQAVRSLGARRGLTALIVGTLALGIGSSAAIFSIVNALLLKELPVRDPSRLVFVRTAGADKKADGAQSFSRYLELRAAAGASAGARAFEGLAAFAVRPLTIRDGTESERVLGELVTGNYFDTLGVQAALGRTLTVRDDRRGRAEPVAVLSHGYWRRRFAADPAIIGRTVRLNSQPFTIVGVTPPAFFYVEWAPRRATGSR